MTSLPQGSSLDSNRAAGSRLELLLFKLDHPQRYGINVFKVQEVVGYQPLTQMPNTHRFIKGVATLRGITMPILDLAQAIGMQPLENPEQGQIIITEYNRSVHGFLIRHVDRIVYTQWDQVQQLPKALGRNTYVTAVTLIENMLIEILDVEKVLDQVVHASTELSATLASQTLAQNHRVMVVDDSSVARHQIQRALEQLGMECVLVTDGKRAMELFENLIADGIDIASHFAMVISDVEMPEMDGYQLTTWMRSNPHTRSLYILLHSSISGEFNADMVKRTGANRFIQKYHPDDLAQAVLDQIGQQQQTTR